MAGLRRHNGDGLEYRAVDISALTGGSDMPGGAAAEKRYRLAAVQDNADAQSSLGNLDAKG